MKFFLPSENQKSKPILKWVIFWYKMSWVVTKLQRVCEDSSQEGRIAKIFILRRLPSWNLFNFWWFFTFIEKTAWFHFINGQHKGLYLYFLCQSCFQLPKGTTAINSCGKNLLKSISTKFAIVYKGFVPSDMSYGRLKENCKEARNN